MPDPLRLALDFKFAVEQRGNQAVVALESTVIAHGLPRPKNLEVAREMEATVRRHGAAPATIAVIEGQPIVGLSDEQLELLANQNDVMKAGRRDLAVAIAQKRTAATTVSATMFLAHQAGIRVFATGGIGGAHRGAEHAWDISADLIELARTPVAVVCAGAKSILDIPRTLEILETHGVPVLCYRCDEFPAFYLRSSGESAPVRVDSVAEIVDILSAHWQMNGAGVVIAQPVTEDSALDEIEYHEALQQVEEQARRQGIRGKPLTPFLLAGVAKATVGKSLRANEALLIANARLAAEIAVMSYDMRTRDLPLT